MIGSLCNNIDSMARSDTCILPLSSSSWDFCWRASCCLPEVRFSNLLTDSLRSCASPPVSEALSGPYLLGLAWTCLDLIQTSCIQSLCWDLLHHCPQWQGRATSLMPQPAVWDIQALKRLCRTSAHLHEVKLLGKITINCLIFIMPVPTKDPSARGHHRSYAALSLSHSRPTSLGPTGFGCLLDDATETTFVAKPVRQAEKIREARWRKFQK